MKKIESKGNVELRGSEGEHKVGAPPLSLGPTPLDPPKKLPAALVTPWVPPLASIVPGGSNPNSKVVRPFIPLPPRGSNEGLKWSSPTAKPGIDYPILIGGRP